MTKRRFSVRSALAVALLASAVYAGAAGYWLSSNRLENANERAYVASSDDQDTREQVIRRCGGPIPAPAEQCVSDVEESEERKQHERADLKAQQEVAEWTFATALIAFAALFLSAGGLWALVWTFREQRKLTINQSRSYLELLSAHYTADRYGSIEEGEDTEDSISVTLVITNNGSTPALNVRAELVLECARERGHHGEFSGSDYVIEGISGKLSEIPAKGTYILHAFGHGVIPYATMEDAGWRYIPPTVAARGKVFFQDVFSTDTREFEIKLDASDVPRTWNDPPIEFQGPHRARHGTDRVLSHHKARWEKHLAEVAKARATDSDPVGDE